MSVQVENLEKSMAKLTIEVSAEKLEEALQEAYNRQKNRISLPGFRKGKVPRNMVEKMYGPEIFYEDAANIMMQEAYPAAIDESGVDIVSQPTVDVVQLEKGKPFIFTAEVAVKPEVKLGEYKGLKVDKYSTRVTQKEVDEEIEKVREQHARIIEVTDRAVADKDDVTLDFENVDMNDVNVYVAFKNNGKLVGMKMPQTSELKGIDLIDKEYTDIEVYAWDNKQEPYANIVRIVNNVQ